MRRLDVGEGVELLGRELVEEVVAHALDVAGRGVRGARRSPRR